MKRVLLLLLIIDALFIKAQNAPAIEWQKSIGGPEAYPNSIQQTTDDGYIIAGNSKSNRGDVTGNHGGNDFWIVKLDSAGKIIWQKSLGGSYDDFVSSVIQTTDGGFIAAGSSSSLDGDVTGNHGARDIWVVKLNPSGVIEWQKTYGGSYSEAASAIQQTTDGGYIVAGSSSSKNGDVTGNHGSSDGWIIKLDSTGIIQWQKSLGGSLSDGANSIQQTTDGGYIVAGDTHSSDGDITSNHGNGDFWVVKLNSLGVIEWQKTLGGTEYDAAYSVQQTTDGGYVIAGETFSKNGDVIGNHGNADFWVVKLDALGNILWQKTFGADGYEAAYSIKATKNGNFIIAGESRSDDLMTYYVSNDYFLVKIDAAGNLIWQKKLGGTDNDYAIMAQQTKDDGYIIAGMAYSINLDVTEITAKDIWIVKLKSEALDIQDNAGLEEIDIGPNPVKDKIYLKNINKIQSLKIYDVAGKLVKTKLGKNNYLIVSDLAPGKYFLQIITDKKTYTKKIIKN